ncbi:hypothetical protein IKE83_01860 [Candidatus Saccharibacteria bacterium]|nr:hypothetical protein [Candidatus Saccharibacteria bacterium]
MVTKMLGVIACASQGTYDKYVPFAMLGAALYLARNLLSDSLDVAFEIQMLAKMRKPPL